MPKVAIVNTSATQLGSHPTGLWLEECAAPYYKFKEAGFEVVLASTAGGPVPIDAGSLGEGFFTEHGKKFMHDPEAMGGMSHSVKVGDLDLSTMDALFMSGGHGTCVDFVDNGALKAAIEKMYADNKVVAAVCHGPNCLAQCKKPDGSALVAGGPCTGFSNTEEEAVKLTGAVPWLIEDKFKELGGLYEKGDDWTCKVTVAGKLICGQNPQSSEAAADAVVAALK